MSGADRDLTPLAPIGMGRTRSGPVREQRPVYVDLLPPCNAGCPAGENIQSWLALVKAGNHEGAWRALTVDNPFPAVHGRVCYHPCETACNRVELDGAVSIHGVERFLGDLAIEHGWAFDPPPEATGRRVLVIGSGPSGLSAAYHLRRMGHGVMVRDSGSEPGGMMRYGIPSYRLPRVVLDAEIDRLRAIGVGFEQDHRVVDLQAEMRDGSFDAAFVASAPTSRPGSTSPTRTPHASSTPSSSCAARRRAPRRRSPARSRSTAAATRRWMPRASPAASAPTTPSSSTAAPASRCRPTSPRRRTPRPRASGSTGCAPSARWATTTSPSRSRSSTSTASRTAPAGSRRSRPTRSSSRSGRRATPASCTASRASSSSATPCRSTRPP